MLCVRSKAEFSWVTLGGIIVGGGLTWVFGRTAIHIGASGLVFCFFGYLASLAFFKRNLMTIGLSVVCILVYGGVLKGVLPNAGPVSWEGHLAGLLAGIIAAWVGSKEIMTEIPGVKTP
jgi:membrane associated rhomboid family serine protease